MRKKITLGILFLATTLLFDQSSKLVIFAWLDSMGQGYVTIFPFFSFVKVWNTGVSFGMFQDMVHGPLFFSLLGLCITGILAVWLAKAETLLQAIALGMVIGGALGNIIDRLRFGAVADFLDFHIGAWHWPAFNIADSAVCIGVTLLIGEHIFFLKKGENTP